MERKKIKIIELPVLESEILASCIFSEPFELIANECNSENNVNVIADAIKNLLHLKLLIAVNETNALTWVYDGDKMRENSFKATAQGVEWIEHQS